MLKTFINYIYNFTHPMREELIPSGLSTHTLEIADMQMLKDFDRLATYEQNDTPDDHQPPEYTNEELAPGLEKREITGIFDENGKMVAYYWLELKPDELYVGGLAVHPEWRNRGIAKFIMQQAEETAIAHGRNKCTLTVDPYNGRGVHVYLKDGYRIVSYERDAFGTKGCVRFHMEKKLTTREGSQYSEERQISVHDNNAAEIENTLAEGFIGTRLIRSEQGDNNNVIVFNR